MKTLEELAETGFDSDAIKASVNTIEFQHPGYNIEVWRRTSIRRALGDCYICLSRVFMSSPHVTTAPQSGYPTLHSFSKVFPIRVGIYTDSEVAVRSELLLQASRKAVPLTPPGLRTEPCSFNPAWTLNPGKPTLAGLPTLIFLCTVPWSTIYLNTFFQTCSWKEPVWSKTDRHLNP